MILRKFPPRISSEPDGGANGNSESGIVGMEVTEGGNCQSAFHFPISDKYTSDDPDVGVDDRGKTVVGCRVVKMIPVTRNSGHG